MKQVMRYVVSWRSTMRYVRERDGQRVAPFSTRQGAEAYCVQHWGQYWDGMVYISSYFA